VTKQREGRVGTLVIRAFAEEGGQHRLLVELLEVNPLTPDQVIGVVDSPAAASRLVGDWLTSFSANTTGPAGGSQQPAQGDR
jgi:hypothetical protein